MPAPAHPPDHPDFEQGQERAIPPEVLEKRISDFDLRIEGRPLGKVIERFRAELEACELRQVKPVFYLTDGWGVPEGTVAIGLPFYLADDELRHVQARRGGMVEGESDDDILRYLRHEMGHVVNYAYQLYATEEWTKLFGPMSRPYLEEYKVVPFSPDFVRHLPGGYAQKHPDEDWAETFALWMTPGLDWRALYADAPGALRKLEYCHRTLLAVRDRAPDVVDATLDVEAKDLNLTVQEYYAGFEVGSAAVPKSLDGDLAVIFARPPVVAESGVRGRTGDAATLLRRQADELCTSVYRWTGVDPAVIAPLVEHFAKRARELKLTYALASRDEVLIELASCLTTLAMNYVYRGKLIGG
jgi:hypothetical protein